MVLFVGVCYKTPQQASEFARLVLSTAENRSVRVLIVDNTDDNIAETPFALANDQRVMWLRSPSNLGYFGGAAYALHNYLRTHELPDWVVISNVDLLLDAGAFLRVLHPYAGKPDVGVVAPAVVSKSTGRQLNPFMVSRPSAIRMHFYKWAFAWAWSLKSYASLANWWWHVATPAATNAQCQVSRRVYAVHGCIIAFSATYFRRGGTLSHGAFLYGEEITVAELCRQNSLGVFVDRGAIVEHLDARSTSRKIDTKVAKWVAEGARYCADRYFPLTVFARLGSGRSRGHGYDR